jgi:N-hydroxyarylamine O-acetyltransferase
MVNLAAYLARIGHSRSTEPSAEILRELHREHIFTVPFENLDIHLGRTIFCDETRFLHKIVDERRGGFCYELNGAFAVLLRALKFEVTLLSARVTRADGIDGPEFDHMALLVQVSHAGDESQWLADVGFGDNFVEPLRFEPGLEHPEFGRTYRVSKTTDRFQMECMAAGKWEERYSFTVQPRQLCDFAAMCQYHQTSPESHFTRQRICSLATPQGRISLSDLKMIENQEGQRKERLLSGEQEWLSVLGTRFGIDLVGAPGSLVP